MKDTIQKGTGNSRYLKSIDNFLTQYPTYADFAAAMSAGTLPIDLNGINMDGIEQLGTALSKKTLLTDDVAESIGIASADPTVNEALDMLQMRIGSIGSGSAVMTITVTDPSGIALEGVEIVGLVDSSGANVTTNSLGKASGLITSGTTQLTFVPPYVDIAVKTASYTVEAGGVYHESCELEAASSVVITSSMMIVFSTAITDKVVTAKAVGGGGGGGGGYSDASYYPYGGSGGGGGYITNQEVHVDPMTSYEIIIGAGGDGGPSANTSIKSNTGGNGGTTSGLGISAGGGYGGDKTTGGAGTGSGGVGAYYANTGGAGWDGSDGYGGGGGGGNNGAGGAGGGGSGANGYVVNGSNGTDGTGGGGGGGGAGTNSSFSYGGRGGSGAFVITIT